ncbi:hypothetical protein [Brucella endophytica]|uniref:hypothetical protein n=1 Tax=Brucella endophytica TaxID=1963359 RepID=UPI001669D54B|nr:hypothetical protein [Brucella endophytica]
MKKPDLADLNAFVAIPASAAWTTFRSPLRAIWAMRASAHSSPCSGECLEPPPRVILTKPVQVFIAQHGSFIEMIRQEKQADERFSHDTGF